MRWLPILVLISSGCGAKRALEVRATRCALLPRGVAGPLPYRPADEGRPQIEFFTDVAPSSVHASNGMVS